MSDATSSPIVRLAWSGEDTSLPTLPVEGTILGLTQSGAFEATYATTTAAGSSSGDAVVVGTNVSLLGRRRHIVRVTASSVAPRGAYLSVCVAGDPSRELLAPEASTLASSGSDQNAVQLEFQTPHEDGVYDVRVRLRGARIPGGKAVTIHRVLLVEMDGVQATPQSVPSVPASLGASLFPTLPPLASSSDTSLDLANSMVLTSESEARYLTGVGSIHSFVLALVARDIKRPVAGTKPAIDLRSVYGFSTDRTRLLDRRLRFKIDGAAHDLHRDAYGAATVADTHADDSYADAQVHLLLLRFHNRVMDHFQNANAQQGLNEIPLAELFERARRCVVTHWQWAVFYDTVRMLVDTEVFKDICHCGQRFFTVYSPETAPSTPPPEFTRALAYLHLFLRRDTYPLSRRNMVISDEQSRYYVGGLRPPAPLDLRAMTLGQAWRAGALDSYVPRSSARIAYRDGGFHGSLHDSEQSDRKTMRSPVLKGLNESNARLAGGYSIAKRMGIAPLSEDEIRRSDRTGVYRSLNLSSRRTPLLPYVLKESETRRGGMHLTGVGARLLAELVRGFIWSAPTEICCFANDWRPSLPRANSETYAIHDIVQWTLRPTHGRSVAPDSDPHFVVASVH